MFCLLFRESEYFGLTKKEEEMLFLSPGVRSALTVGLLIAFSGCSHPEALTDLLTEGPPEVNAVTVISDSRMSDLNRDGFADDTPEVATFCLQGEGVRVHRGICPVAKDEGGQLVPGKRTFTPVTDADPADWFARIVFSELLDPDVEDLVDDNDDGVFDRGSLEQTQPVVLLCNDVEVPYSGYYDPSGNDVTYPPGPSLVIEPSRLAADFVATGSSCSLEIKAMVTDKEGNPVPEELRGPYVFGVADMRISSLPADSQTGLLLQPELGISFNAVVDVDSAAGLIVLSDGVTEIGVTLSPGELPTSILVTPSAPLAPSTEYTLTVSSGIQDVAGGALTLSEPEVRTFTTRAVE